MKNIVFLSGIFNVLHPGHIRLFKFARDCGEKLVVAVESDRLAGVYAHVCEGSRLESVRSCSLVDEVLLLDEPMNELLIRLQPRFVVKGKEHGDRYNVEAETVASYGGQLIFSSGEIPFTEYDLLQRDYLSLTDTSIQLPRTFMERHNVLARRLSGLVSNFRNLRVLTIGDLIVDDYIDCEPLGMSQEDPTLVVAPTCRMRYVGGAGIVAAHGAGLGADSSLISIIGEDSVGKFCIDELKNTSVKAELITDESRPTSLKERYRSHGKTLLRVSHLHQTAIPVELQKKILRIVEGQIKNIDLLIFSDFNYGALPQTIVDSLSALAKSNGVIVAADSQSSSQLGDIGRFKDVDLLTPTEREARVSIQNREDGLVVLAEKIRKKSNAKLILLKLGADGVLIHAPNSDAGIWLTDRIEALNKFPKDVAGAGDSMLVASALTLASGGNIWEAACVGSLVSALQVSKIGNAPLDIRQLEELLS